jgi:hypothetical protein
MVWFGGAAEIFSQDASFMNELVLIAAELVDFCRKRWLDEVGEGGE